MSCNRHDLETVKEIQRELDSMMAAWVTAQVEDLEEAIMDPDSPLERMMDYREALKHLRWLKNNWI